MISTELCRVYSADCVTQRMEANISVQRATMLMAMSRSWATLANQTDQYNDLVMKEETLGRLRLPTSFVFAD